MTLLTDWVNISRLGSSYYQAALQFYCKVCVPGGVHATVTGAQCFH
jgi:hypothetical protein